MCVIVRALSMMLGRMYLVGFDCVEATSAVIIDTKLIRAAGVLENPLLNTPKVRKNVFKSKIVRLCFGINSMRTYGCNS